MITEAQVEAARKALQNGRGIRAALQAAAEVDAMRWDIATASYRAQAAYLDRTKPARNCERCGNTYHGPAVYCCLACALEDAVGQHQTRIKAMHTQAPTNDPLRLLCPRCGSMWSTLQIPAECPTCNAIVTIRTVFTGKPPSSGAGKPLRERG